MVSPAQRRKAANYLVRRFKVSQRRACKVVGQHRSTQRYAPIVPEMDAKLVIAMNELATQHPRWGYRSVAKLLRDQGWPVNVKRVERLWRQEGHRLPPSKLKDSGQKARGVGENSSINRPAERTNHIWTYDFVSARVRRGGPIRILNVLDEFTRVSLGSKVSRSIGANSVVEHLEQLFETHGTPSAIRSDNGREFIAATVVDWLKERGVEAVFIEKASPTQNPFIERFNGTMRRDLLNVEEFHSVTEAQVLVDQFNDEYNHLRPHRSLRMMTPHAFAESLTVGAQ
jgi:putative transposase